MELFYFPHITADHLQMSETESKHIIRVLRFKSGDKIFLTDGKGNLHEAEIEDENPKACSLK